MSELDTKAEVSTVERLRTKQARLQQEIANYQAQINELVERHETAQMAHAQCSILIQEQTET